MSLGTNIYICIYIFVEVKSKAEYHKSKIWWVEQGLGSFASSPLAIICVYNWSKNRWGFRVWPESKNRPTLVITYNPMTLMVYPS